MAQNDGNMQTKQGEWIRPGIRVEQLGNGIQLCTNERHGFGTDAFLLSHFARPKAKDIACDLGCGCGIVPLLWYRRPGGPRSTLLVDIQREAVGLARQSVDLSGLGWRLSVVCADLRTLPPELERKGFDLITCNPPYKEAGAGVMSERESDRIARHETMCTLDDICAAAARLLRFGGRLCLCQRSERLTDVLVFLRKNGVEPKRLRFVHKNEKSEPWLLLVEGKLGAKPGLRIDAPLILYRDTGEMTPEFAEISQYGEG